MAGAGFSLHDVNWQGRVEVITGSVLNSQEIKEINDGNEAKQAIQSRREGRMQRHQLLLELKDQIIAVKETKPRREQERRVPLAGFSVEVDVYADLDLGFSDTDTGINQPLSKHVEAEAESIEISHGGCVLRPQMNNQTEEDQDEDDIGVGASMMGGWRIRSTADAQWKGMFQHELAGLMMKGAEGGGGEEEFIGGQDSDD